MLLSPRCQTFPNISETIGSTRSRPFATQAVKGGAEKTPGTRVSFTEEVALTRHCDTRHLTTRLDRESVDRKNRNRCQSSSIYPPYLMKHPL